MTGLPQGVTLDPDGPLAAWVLHDGRRVGLVGYWRAGGFGARGIGAVLCADYGPPVRERHGFATLDHAARWVALAARPVVYRVVPVLSPCAPRAAFAWQVYDPAGAYVAQTYDRVQAMTIARAEAQRALRMEVRTDA